MSDKRKSDKLQVCVSFKHTKEEEELYWYVIDQNDKSIFIKNLIRQHKNGNTNKDYIKQDDIIDEPHKEDVKEKKISNGKKTRNKYLA